jgi:hypothetical protein
MDLPQNGTIATMPHDQITSPTLTLYKVTSTENFDKLTVYNKLTLCLDKLENELTGFNEDIDSLSVDLNRLPRFSHERLECNFRIQSLKKKWGLVKPKQPLQKKETIFPIKLSDVNNFLIEKSHVEYINSGKDGREFIQSHLIQSGITMINSEEELEHFVQDSLQLLVTTIINVHTSSTFDEWKMSLQILGMNSIPKSRTLFKNWMETNKNNLKTIGQLKIWLSNQEKTQLDENVVDTIDTKLLGII